MMTRLLNTLALIACCGLASLGCRGSKSASPPVHLNQNMDNVWRFDMQEPNDFFTDGRASRPHVEGTVAWGSLHGLSDAEYQHLRDGLGSDGKWTDDLPTGMTLDRTMLNRGEARYQIYCVPCHGAAGYGDGLIVQRGMTPPKSFHEDTLRGYPVGRIVWTLRHGVNNMPSYASQIPVEDRWAIATWVRTLQISQTAPDGLAAKGGK